MGNLQPSPTEVGTPAVHCSAEHFHGCSSQTKRQWGIRTLRYSRSRGEIHVSGRIQQKGNRMLYESPLRP